LAWTERVRVGIGLMPVALRNVAITAMELSSMERMFPGRVLPGVGHGVQEWMGQVGARVASPLTLLREYTEALRRLLAGETVTTSGRYIQLDDVSLSWPTPMPVLAGALGPKSLRLCGEIADGLIIAGGTAADARTAFTEAAAGRAASGRTDDFPVTMYLMAATGAGAQERLDREVAEWVLPDPTDAVAVAGDAEAIAAEVRAWADAGANSIVLQPTRDDPDLEGFIRFVADEVRPLV
jgi:alkanesulfonate monooxygenase SsuD/methylene tetrahydromethanopterin reductase-like flavin-dependent oxidoreductase (luciferase family)